MNKRLVLRIKKRTQAEVMIGVIMLLPFAFATLIELLHLPAAIKYTCDIAWLFLLVLIFLQRTPRTMEQKICRWFIVLFFLYTLVGYVFNIQSVLYYLWGARNNFRFYVAFLAFIYFLKERHIEEYLGLFDKLFWLNAAVCMVQFLFFGKRQDYLGGIFGAQRGCNSSLNIFFVIMTIKSILMYLNNRKGLAACVAECGTALLLSALAELKFFYIEFAVIAICAVLLTRFTWKKVMIIAGSLVGVVVTTQLLTSLFPEFEGIFSLEVLLAAASSTSGYTGTGDMNRLTAISMISDRFLKTPWEQLIGMGLGNCETASFSFLTTPFYLRYNHLNYTWISTAFTFLETGYLGLGFFYGFFVLIYWLRGRIGKFGDYDRVYCQMSAIAAVCGIMIGIYNSSLRTEAGYMLYFVLAFPLILQNKSWQEGKSDDTIAAN